MSGIWLHIDNFFRLDMILSRRMVAHAHVGLVMYVRTCAGAFPAVVCMLVVLVVGHVKSAGMRRMSGVSLHFDRFQALSCDKNLTVVSSSSTVPCALYLRSFGTVSSVLGPRMASEKNAVSFKDSVLRAESGLQAYVSLFCRRGRTQILYRDTFALGCCYYDHNSS